MVMPRSRSSGALSMESKERKDASPRRASVLVIAADPKNEQANTGIFVVAKRFTDEGTPKLSVPLFEMLAKARRD
jgi:hypothetical protein